MLGARMLMAASAGGIITDQANYVEVTVQSSQVASNMTNFPVYVDLSDLPAAFFSGVAADGGDIRVTTGNGSVGLPREVVDINTGASTGELHFLANSLSASANTTFRIYYNGTATEPAVTDVYGRNAVWAGYLAVYHGNTADVTGNGNTLTLNNGAVVTAGAGPRGGDAFDFDGADDNASLGSVISTVVDNYTTQAWVFPEEASTGVTSVVLLNGNSSSSGYFLRWRDEDFWHTYGGEGLNNSINGAANAWQAMAAVTRSGTTYLYRNGVENNVDTGATPATPSGDFVVGAANSAGSAALLGLVSEIRFRESGLSADWFSAEYTNQNAPGTFYSVGSEQSA